MADTSLYRKLHNNYIIFFIKYCQCSYTPKIKIKYYILISPHFYHFSTFSPFFFFFFIFFLSFPLFSAFFLTSAPPFPPPLPRPRPAMLSISHSFVTLGKSGGERREEEDSTTLPGAPFGLKPSRFINLIDCNVRHASLPFSNNTLRVHNRAPHERHEPALRGLNL